MRPWVDDLFPLAALFLAAAIVVVVVLAVSGGLG